MRYSADDPPGVCVHGPSESDATLLKGTDRAHVRQRRGFFIVAATPENGLSKPTAFELVPRYCRRRRLLLWYPERHLGKLSDGDLLALRTELARVIG